MNSILSGAAGAAAHDPEKAAESYNAGMAAIEQGDLEGAIGHFQSSIELDPGSAASYQGLANAYYSAERYEEAISAYDKLLEIEPNEELKQWVDQLRASLSPAA